MPLFDGTLAALAAGRGVLYAELTTFQLPGGTLRLWDGVGEIVIDGETYYSNKRLVARDAIGFGENDVASAMSHTLSGVDADLVEAIKGADVRGGEVTVFGQFFDEDWQPYDEKFFLARRVMDVMGFDMLGPRQRAISVTEETIWTNGDVAAYGTYSDVDQQARYPGDLGCGFVAGLQNVKLRWPF